MIWEQIRVKNVLQTSKGQSAKFSHDNFNFVISYKVLKKFEIYSCLELEGKTIYFNTNVELETSKKIKNFSNWLRINKEHISHISTYSDIDENDLEEHELVYNYEEEEDEEFENEDEYEEFFDENIVEKQWDSLANEINFDTIYNSIEPHEIKSVNSMMSEQDKIISKSIKLTKTKFNNGKITSLDYNFQNIYDLAGDKFIEFLKSDVSSFKIKSPKEIKIPQSYKNNNENIINFLKNEGYLEFSTETDKKNFIAKAISLNEFLNNIERRRNQSFTKLRDLQLNANKILYETGVNPLVIAWPYLEGKTNNGTLIHCPVAYQNIKIEETPDFYTVEKTSNFNINTYPLLKNYVENNADVNEIIIEQNTLKDVLIEFFKHGIKITRPVSNAFKNYKKIDEKDNFASQLNNGFFKLTNEVCLKIKEHDEEINYDLRKIVAEYDDFILPEKTFTQDFYDNNEYRERSFLIDLDNSKAFAVKESLKNNSVIFGPPGTGKSESVTAIISEIIISSKTSIFVAEKNTAINVVESNLKKLSLDSFILNLTSPLWISDLIEKFNIQRSIIFKNNNHNKNEEDEIQKIKNINFAKEWVEKNTSKLSFYNLIEEKNISLKNIFIFTNLIDESQPSTIIELQSTINFIVKSQILLENINGLKEVWETEQDNLKHLEKSLQKNKENLSTFIKTIERTSEEELKSLGDEFKKNDENKEKTIQELNYSLKNLHEEFDKKTEELSNVFKKTTEEFKAYFDSLDFKYYFDAYVFENVEKIVKISSVEEFYFDFLKNKKTFLKKREIKKNFSILSSSLDKLKKFAFKIINIRNEEIDTKKIIETLKILIKEIDESTKLEKLYEFLETPKAEQIIGCKQNDLLKKYDLNKKDLNNKILILNQKINFCKTFDPNLNDLDEKSINFLNWVLSEKGLECWKDIEQNKLEISKTQKTIKETLINLNDLDEVKIKKNVNWYFNNKDFIEKYNKEDYADIFNFYSNHKDELNLNKQQEWKKFIDYKKNEIKKNVENFKIIFKRNVINKYRNDEIFNKKLDFVYKKIKNLKATSRNSTASKLLTEYYDVFSVVFPCIASDPNTISKIFPIYSDIFDYSIFDEASQIRLHKAIPSLHRSKQTIIAGDDKQLGPTDLFSNIEKDKETNLDFENDNSFDSETLLNYGKESFRSFLLTTHYRSKSKDLIEFSNKKFYDNKISTADSPLAKYDGNEPIILEEINGLWENRTNFEEAKRVVELTYKYLIHEGKTLGIITFNDEQKQLINKLLIEDEIIREKLSNLDSIFIKSIKEVQGDERDVIIFSIAYGRDEFGQYVKRYGQFSKEKINVAITRAKLRLHVLKSMPSSIVSRKSEDYKIFAEWLEYIENKSKQPDRILKHENSFNSEFEQDYYNELVKVIPNNIRALMNYKTSEDTNFKEIDVALFDDTINRFVGAIELDGLKYHSSTDQMLKDFDRQTFLENIGWKIERVTYRDFYDNKEKCVKNNLAKFKLF